MLCIARPVANRHTFFSAIFVFHQIPCIPHCSTRDLKIVSSSRFANHTIFRTKTSQNSFLTTLNPQDDLHHLHKSQVQYELMRTILQILYQCAFISCLRRTTVGDKFLCFPSMIPKVRQAPYNHSYYAHHHY